jgi:FtsH-binding integral membrane protein
MKKLLKLSAASGVVFVLPLLVGAQDGLNHLIDQVQTIVVRLIPIVIGLALLVFLWGVLTYVISKNDEDKAGARKYMLWGIIGLFVMVSVWGLVTILADSIFGGNRISQPPTVPSIPTTQVQ